MGKKNLESFLYGTRFVVIFTGTKYFHATEDDSRPAGQEVLAFYRNRRFITVSTTAHHYTV